MSRVIVRADEATRSTMGEVWSQYLQRRAMRLLLLHDQQLFHGQFRVFFAHSTLSKIPLLQFYDHYLKLQALGDELLVDILPRIRRQLSLQTNYELVQEDAPTRGDIDWTRTITRAVNETPDQPPLRFDTRMRRENMAIPDNLLLVAILLSYRQAVQDLLLADIQGEALNDQERSLLVNAEERAERELAAPHARVLIEEASRADIDDLIEHVMSQLKPGANPYRDLIAWWEHFHHLNIGKTVAQRHLALTNKRGDEQFDGWLYELWIGLEILDLLNDTHLLVPETVEIESDRLQCLFTWGKQRFRFRYQHPALSTMNEEFGWQGASMLSHYTIEHEQPMSIAPAGKVIWQEPPVMLEASYSSESNEPAQLQASIQQLLGGMQLPSARNGFIFSPMLPDPPEDGQWSIVVQPNKEVYTDRVGENTTIHLYKITPDMAANVLRLRLRAALQQVVKALPERLAPACYGILLDADTVNASRNHIQRGNVLCPKPHLGPGVFDLVDERLHCLKDPRLCHVYGQLIMPPFVIRVDTLGGLEQQSGDLRSRTEGRLREAEEISDEARAEQLRSHVFLGVGRAIEQYVQVHGNTATIEAHFEEWVFGDLWKKHPRHLSEETRNNLLSGEYVWEEYNRTNGLNDWAAPAIQYCRALESEINQRIHDYYPDNNAFYAEVGQKGFSGHMTLGFLETIYSYRGKSPQGIMNPKELGKINSARHNWLLCEAIGYSHTPWWIIQYSLLTA